MYPKRRFKINKLIRDKAAQQLHVQKIILNQRVMDHSEYVDRLKDKIVEEAQEVFVAQTLDEIQEELADVLEVIHALSIACGLSYEAIDAARLQKKNKTGGFEARCYGEFIEYDAHDPAIQYCLAHPDKYPEII